MTVTSITFSVLLLAVQQTASSLTPVVFDQYLRRRTNQLYFGYFIGVTGYAFLVLGLARPDPAPVLGATPCLVLTAVSVVVLLLLIHSTVDQMRPASVVRSIHELALRAREKELLLLGHLRSARRTDERTPERLIRSVDSGYVTTIHVDALGNLVQRMGADCELIIEAPLGDYVYFGELMARLVGIDPEDSAHDAAILSAFRVDDIRDVDAQAGYAIDQLENIAWASATSAGQSPNTATTAVRALADLLGRWLLAGERDRSDRAMGQAELPIVYVDGATSQVMRSFSALLIATADSGQAQTAAEVLGALAFAVPRLASQGDKAALSEAIDCALPAVIQHAEIPQLTRSLGRLAVELRAADMDATRVQTVKELLTLATVRLMPKPSSQPESAHPD